MNIGVVSHLYPTPRRPEAGGFIRDQLVYLAKKVDVRLYSPLVNRYWFDGGIFAEKPPFPALRPRHPLFPRGPWHRLNPFVMAMVMRRHAHTFLDECEVIHAHMAFPDGCAAVRAFGSRKPVVVTVHGSDIHDFARRPSLSELIRTDLNRSDGIIAVSPALADILDELWITAPKWIIPNGIDTTFYSPGPKDEACSRLGLDPDRPRILFAGHFVPVKNISQLVRIAPRLREALPGCELVLLGAEPGNRQVQVLQARIEATGIGNMVRIEPATTHDNLRDWYQASDMFILPSRNEGFGLVLAESLASGRPVVATRCGGPESIVEKGTGRLVPHDDDDAMVDAVCEVVEGKGILAPDELAASIRARFSFEVVIDRIVEVYRMVLAGR